MNADARLNIIKGSSHDTLKIYAAKHPKSCDIISIDGDHSYDGAIQDMLDVLPPDIAEKYRDQRLLFRREEDLPQNYGALCKRYSRMRGPRREWLEYFHRPVVQELWVLSPEEECIAIVSAA